MTDPLLIARNASTDLHLLPQMANRHGLITGATGTGKTVTLQTLAEHFSRIGVPCFMSDVKGDLSGISQPGGGNAKVTERVEMLKLEGFEHQGYPVTLWDPFGEAGHPVRATVSDMGPLLLSRMLNLNDTQSGVLNLVFKVADDNGLLLLDLKDLRTMLAFVGDNAKQFTTEYGNVSSASIGAIQRGLLSLESQGGEQIFGEPMLNIDDLIQTDRGLGVINILAADRLMQSPKMYATLLLWLLAELFENLPEAGDLDKPKLVFFFDEAHLLFSDAPTALVEKIEQVVRLIRSKGVGVYFVTQNPADVPTRCCHSSATGCSTHCARSRRATRRRSAPPPRPCATTPIWMKSASSPNSASAKRWCPFSTPKAVRAWSSAPTSCRRRGRSARSPTRSGSGWCRPRWWPGSTTRPSTASPPMKC
jgi:uncharacterized protein